ncbi:MAG: hypothetical protein IT556_15605, partial [Acetobacteraceae bacterium]|nr:hypothetical protein [Acetobacteraceae bacterium]
MTEASITAPATPAASQPVQAYTPGADEAALLALSREWMEIAARRPREEPQLARLRAIM